MQPPAIPPIEHDRLRALRALEVLDTPPEERFDRLTRLARRLLGTPIALISLVDESRQWFKSRQGLEATETPRDISFCGHAILGDGPFVVEDAANDPRFRDNPLVAQEPNIRLYAGIPLKSAAGDKLGTLCVIDRKPRSLGGEEIEALKDLAKLVEAELRADKTSIALGVAQEAGSRLSDILDNVGDMIQSVDPAGRFLYVNRVWRETLGYEESDLETLDVFQIVHPDSLPRCQAAFKRVSAGEHLSAVQAVLVAKDGRRLEVEGNITPRMERGRLVSTRASFRDVSERRKSERALAESEARFRELAEKIDEVFWITTPDLGKILYISPAYERIWGRTPQSLYGRPMDWVEAVHPEDRARVEQAAIKERPKGPFVQEYRIVRRDGTTRWISDRSFPVRGDSGEVARIVGIAADVTELRAREIELAEMNAGLEKAVQERTKKFVEANERLLSEIKERARTEKDLRRHIAFEKLVATLSTHFILLQPGGIEAGVNEALDKLGSFADVDRCYIFQFSEDGSMLSNTYEWCAPGVESHIRNLQKLPAGSFPWLEPRIKRAEIVHVPRVKELPPEAQSEKDEFDKESIQSIICVPMLLSGKVIGFLAFDSVKREVEWSQDSIALLKIAGEMFINALERKRSEEAFARSQEQLRMAQRLESIGRLSGGVAHDFNNILTVILGISDIHLRQLKEGDPLREDIEEIHAAGKRAAGLTRQLLAFSRKQVLAPTVLDINELAANISRMLKRLIGEDIELTMKPGAQKDVYADAGQLEQVIMNLAVNARDAMPQGGKLVIETSDVEIDAAEAEKLSFPMRPGAYVRLAVSDAGTGMDEKTLANIYEPFFTTKEPGKGTGLGLSTVYGIVKQSGGFIDVKSKLGEGTTFHIYLPKTERIAAAAETGAKGKSLAGAETILVVEDEAPVRRLAGRILSGFGYKVLEAEDGESALSLLKGSGDRVDLVLCDIVMPGMRGVQLAGKIEKAWPKARVLLMTGYADKSLLNLADDDGKWDVLQKPFTPGDLAGKVRAVLDRRAA